jgi:xanthine dehydrogenase small subunit
MPLDAFYLGYQKTALDAGEFVAEIRVPRPVAALRFRTYKVSKRYDQDISAVCAAFAIRLDDDNRVTDARIAFGGMAATPKRAANAEAALIGQEWSEATARDAMAALDADFQPLTDMRASSEYRAKVARNVLWRFYLETRRDTPLALAEVNAFAYEAHAASQEQP